MRQRNKNSWFKRFAAALFASLLCLGLIGALGACSNSNSTTSEEPAKTEESSEATTRMFTDSLGREVEVPTEITKIAPSGHTATQVLITMAPEKLVGLSLELTPDQQKYIGTDVSSLPVFGAAFGASGDLNKEAVAASGAQTLIDTGESKDGMKEDLDTLQSQLGIPCVFINTPLDDYSTAYEMLGDLLGMEERGKELGDYCKNAYDETESVMAKIPADKRVNMAYLLGDAGLNAIAKGSYQGSIIDMCANNVVVVEKASGSGMGNEINFEQLAVWNPDLIVFGPKSIYSTAGDDAAWGGISAIQNDKYYEVPSEPWNWLNGPPTVNQVLDMQWLPRLLYPDQYNNDMQDVVTEYYKLFYGYDLSDAEYQELTKSAQPK